ncbi:hypothetical protein H5410_015007 [Solanum commersonii]|uniref:Uncharacterized protein n=1 Tax=Solanum commersonii TaxID=4109 RepID=A0A9J5ZT60_SOLCO|nr:hypothetical protein H5410_015007 [Solanum commersonii]
MANFGQNGECLSTPVAWLLWVYIKLNKCMFGELGRACRSTQRLTKLPLDCLLFHAFVERNFVTFGEKPEFAECTRQLTKCLL